MLENLGENTCGNYTFVRIEKEWRLGQSYTIRHFHWRSDIFGTVFTSLHWKGLNWEDDGPQNVGSLKCIGDGVQMSFKTVQGEGPVSTCAPWLSWRALCGREWAGRTFWQNGGSEDENCLAQSGAPWAFSALTLHAGRIGGKDLGCPTVTHERGKEIIPRWIWPVRKNDDATLCSVTLYREKKRDLIDGSVRGKGRDADDEEVSGGSHLEEWWCLSPHGLWLWAQQVSLAQLMAPDTQAVAVILSDVPRPSSSQRCRRLHYWGPILHRAAGLPASVKMNEKITQALQVFAITLSLLSWPALVYVLSCLPPELWGRRPLASPTPRMICETLKRGSPQRLRKIGCFCSNQRVIESALACPGMGRGSLPLSFIKRIPFPFLSTEWIELLWRIRTDKFSKASFPARRRQNVILMLEATGHGAQVCST